MIEEMSKSAYDFETTKQYQSHLKRTMSYLKDKIKPCDVVLDLGARNPLTDLIERRLSANIHNTDGDLDMAFVFPRCIYDVIVYSHTIEHQFNPLNTLLMIKDYMSIS